jgi:hypothetical protein
MWHIKIEWNLRIRPKIATAINEEQLVDVIYLYLPLSLFLFHSA